MSLNDLTVTSVSSAIDEFNALGRDQFLQKYGFSSARSYFIVRNGERYDSKAIAGAAHGYLGKESVPLKREEFSGGESTVARVLRKLGFDVVNTQPRNPDWVRDELILALDFYLKHSPHLPDKASDEIEQLSKQINELDKKIGLSGGDTFRNINGVYMKLMNFRRLDPAYTEDGKVGLRRGSKEEEIVWNEFSGDPQRLDEITHAIRDSISFAPEEVLDNLYDDPDFTEAEEGRLLTRVHRRRERKRKLVQQKKKSFTKKYGRVFCEACGFDFEQTYGQRGSGFIECHHTKPIHTLRPGEKTKLDDLKLLCSNCHRMVHAKSQWLEFDELKELLVSRT